MFSLAVCERVAAPMLVPLSLLSDLCTPLGHWVLSGDLGGQAVPPGMGTLCCRRGLLVRLPFAGLRRGLGMPGDTGMQGPVASEAASAQGWHAKSVGLQQGQGELASEVQRQ